MRSHTVCARLSCRKVKHPSMRSFFVDDLLVKGVLNIWHLILSIHRLSNAQFHNITSYKNFYLFTLISESLWCLRDEQKEVTESFKSYRLFMLLRIYICILKTIILIV